MTVILVALAAALAGGILVWLYYAMRPEPFEEPRYRYLAGARLEQVSGLASARPRILVALGALVACLIFLSGAIPALL